MDFYKIAELIGEFGYPVVLSLGMGYFIFFVWKFITQDLKPTLGKSHGELIRLLDQIRMLDNDLIFGTPEFSDLINISVLLLKYFSIC